MNRTTSRVCKKGPQVEYIRTVIKLSMQEQDREYNNRTTSRICKNRTKSRVCKNRTTNKVCMCEQDHY